MSLSPVTNPTIYQSTCNAACQAASWVGKNVKAVGAAASATASKVGSCIYDAFARLGRTLSLGINGGKQGFFDLMALSRGGKVVVLALLGVTALATALLYQPSKQSTCNGAHEASRRKEEDLSSTGKGKEEELPGSPLASPRDREELSSSSLSSTPKASKEESKELAPSFAPKTSKEESKEPASSPAGKEEGKRKGSGSSEDFSKGTLADVE